MAKIVFLGTASAIADQTHDNTHLLIQNEGRIVLVDCGGNPGPRLIRTGIDPDRITDLLLTHFHPDHVAGAPLWLMNLWLQGRTQTLTVHGLEHTIQQSPRLQPYTSLGVTCMKIPSGRLTCKAGKQHQYNRIFFFITSRS